MNVLLITPYIPYPLSEGGKISQYAVIDYLRRYHKITLILIAYSYLEIDYITSLKALWPNVEIETLSFIDNKKSSVGDLLKAKIKHLLNYNKRIIGKSNNSVFDNPIYTNFPSIKSRHFIEELFKILSKKDYDIVQVDHTFFIDIVYLLPENVKKVFVHHEIMFARLESSLNNSKAGVYEKYILNSIKHTEVKYLSQYNAVFVFSNVDRNKLLSLGLRNIYNAPFPVLDDYFIPVDKSNTKIEKLIFLGGEEHSPNKDAVNWYIEKIAPLVEKYSNIKLHIIGNWSEETIQKYKSNNSIVFTGYIEDTISYCKNSIMVVPVRIGSGIRTKILYAMAQGVPVVSASIGCEGIAIEDKKSILIADTAIEFSNSIKKLLKEPDFCYHMIEEAQTIAKSTYSQSAVTNLRNKLFDEIISQDTSSTLLST